MHILFYSCNSNSYRGQDFFITSIKSCYEEWEEFCELHPDCKITLVTALPGSFLLDLQGNEVKKKCSKVQYIILPAESSEEEIADRILHEKADLVLAASFYEKPYDWLGMKDAIVKELLVEKGVKAFCNSLYSQINSFDKFRTHKVLEELNIKSADYVYVHHNLYQVAGNKKDILENVYKSAVLYQIKNLHYPLVIKDTVGLSSYSMEVVNTFAEAENYLKSRRFNSDRLFEEFLDGIQFGLEIEGCPGHYTILKPFIFSVNRFGLTSPKQSIKIGPLTPPDFPRLEKDMLRLAEKMEFYGRAQVDLVYRNSKWYVIEVNPRLSGMSTSYAASRNKNFYQMIYDSYLPEGNCKEGRSKEKTFLTMNFKLPLLPEKELEKISKLPHVKHLHQIENLAHLQIRDAGYCEIILSGFDSISELQEYFNDFKNKNSSLVEEIFFQRAALLFEQINQFIAM